MSHQKELLKKLESLSLELQNAKLEAIKEGSYSDGYMDALNDILSGEVEFSKVLNMKYDAQIKTEDYSLMGAEIENMINFCQKVPEKKVQPHPSSVAAETMARLAKSRAKQAGNR